jgi:hypothetical protein
LSGDVEGGESFGERGGQGFAVDGRGRLAAIHAGVFETPVDGAGGAPIVVSKLKSASPPEVTLDGPSKSSAGARVERERPPRLAWLLSSTNASMARFLLPNPSAGELTMIVSKHCLHTRRLRQ